MSLLDYGNETIVLCVGTILTLSYWYLTSNFDYWKKKNIVSDKAYPLLGTYGEALLMRENIAVVIQKIYQHFENETMIGGFVSKKPTLIVKDTDVIKNILIKDFDHFYERGVSPKMEREILLQHLFLSNGDTWKALRQELTPSFASGKIKKMYPVLAECGKEFQKYLHIIVKSGKVPEMKDLMSKFTVDSIGSCAFGIKLDLMNDKNNLIIQMARTLIEPSVFRTVKYAVLQFFPGLFELLKLRITSTEMENFFLNLFKTVIHSRYNEPSVRHDFIDLLLKLKTKGFIHNGNGSKLTADSTQDIEMTDCLLAAQGVTFFLAGFDTSSATLSFALYELAKNQDIQTKLINETEEMLQKYDRKITYEALNEMRYLKMVINETLRMYPPVGLISRECMVPYKIPNTQITIDKGVLVHIPLYALHHDQKNFLAPGKFTPERFTAAELAERSPYMFMPFGKGPRSCIGEKFALLLSMIGLVSILEDFRVEVCDKTVPEIKFAAASFVLECKDGIYLKLNPRK